MYIVTPLYGVKYAYLNRTQSGSRRHPWGWYSTSMTSRRQLT